MTAALIVGAGVLSWTVLLYVSSDRRPWNQR